MRRVAEEIERPVTFGCVQHDIAPDDWRRLLDAGAAAADAGIPLHPQVTGRPVGLVLGLQTRHPLFHRPTFTALSRLPLDERVRPPARARRPRPHPERDTHGGAARLLRHGPRPHLRARRPARLRAAAGDERDGPRRARASTPWSSSTTCCSKTTGTRCCCARCSATATATSTRCTRCSLAPSSVFGIGDGGAHVRVISDASSTTFMLTHWVRDRSRGPRLPLELAVHKMTANNAALYGIRDRGVIAAGMRADLNVIDLDHLALHPPEYVSDLPGGAGRLVQRATGYRATIVAGEVTRAHDADTGARPGRLVRSSMTTFDRSRPTTSCRSASPASGWRGRRSCRRRATRRPSSRRGEQAQHVAARVAGRVQRRPRRVGGRLVRAPAGPSSVLIVRGDDGELPQFQNVCRTAATCCARARARGSRSSSARSTTGRGTSGPAP